LSHLLTLDLPARTGKPGKGSLTNPRRVKAWLGGLPLADPGEAARQVFHALGEVNRLRLPPAERFKVLEALWETVSFVDQTLRRHLEGVAFPLPEAKARFARLVQAFDREMAIGYKAVVVDLAEHGAWLHRRIRATAVQRAVRYLGRVLLDAYQVYAPYPHNVWRDIHRLYAFAEQEGLHRAPVADPLRPDGSPWTVADAVQQVLLLSLASPYQLRQGDAARVYAALEDWAALCELVPVGTRAAPQGLFAVSADGDEQPIHLQLRAKGTLGAGWVLDTARLGAHLRQEAEVRRAAREEGAAPGGRGTSHRYDIPTGLLERLMDAWGMFVRRRFVRVPASLEVEAAFGLRSVHEVIAQADRCEEPGAGCDEGQERVDLTGGAEVGWSWFPREEAPLPAPCTGHCRVVDRSPGGFRLAWPGRRDLRARVGELVGLHGIDGDADAAAWRIAVVRWMKSAGADRVEMGVQLLAPTATPVALRALREDGGRSECLHGLMLPGVDIFRQPPTLVAPSVLARFADRVLVSEPEREYLVRLGAHELSTGAFTCFGYASADGEPPAPPRRRQGE
jgi:hypothetical protein